MTNRILALIACAVLIQVVVSAQQARHPPGPHVLVLDSAYAGRPAIDCTAFTYNSVSGSSPYRRTLVAPWW